MINYIKQNFFASLRKFSFFYKLIFFTGFLVLFFVFNIYSVDNLTAVVSLETKFYSEHINKFSLEQINKNIKNLQKQRSEIIHSKNLLGNAKQRRYILINREIEKNMKDRENMIFFPEYKNKFRFLYYENNIFSAGFELDYLKNSFTEKKIYNIDQFALISAFSLLKKPNHQIFFLNKICYSEEDVEIFFGLDYVNLSTSSRGTNINNLKFLFYLPGHAKNKFEISFGNSFAFKNNFSINLESNFFYQNHVNWLEEKFYLSYGLSKESYNKYLILKFGSFFTYKLKSADGSSRGIFAALDFLF